MDQQQIILLLVVGAALFFVAVYVRIRFGEQYELKPLDLVLVILPLLFFAIVTGKITDFDAFGVKAQIVSVADLSSA